MQLTLIDLIALLYEYLLLLIFTKNERGVQLRIPFGTLLPYFMEDSNHAYVIVPGYYPKDVQVDAGGPVNDTKRTASDGASMK